MKRKKVCVVITSLSKGGAERFCSVLSSMLFQLGYQVHLLVINNDIDYEFEGTLFCLKKEIGEHASGLQKVKTMRRYFKEHKFDTIIDNRPRFMFFKQFIYQYFIFKSKDIVYVIHNHNIQLYLPPSKFLAKILYPKNTKHVCVSQAIKELVIRKYGFKNCINIYNPADRSRILEKSNEAVEVTEDYILYFGRIANEHKNLSLLLEAYKLSTLIEKGIKLYIIGSGPDIDILNEQVKVLKIEDFVTYIPFVENPFPYVKQALFTTLTSRYEGFPMSLLESLVCGTPIVSVDCKSGPREVIQHEYNGLLVENNNPELLSQAYNRFVEDKVLYTRCKDNTKNSVDAFSIDVISKAWETLIESK